MQLQRQQQQQQQLSDPKVTDQGMGIEGRRSNAGGARGTKLRPRRAGPYGALLLMATLVHRSTAAGYFKVCLCVFEFSLSSIVQQVAVHNLPLSTSMIPRSNVCTRAER